MCLRALLYSLAAFAAGLGWAATTARAQEPLREEPGFLRVQIDGRMARLETLIVRPDGASGRLPLALITHGKAPNNAKMSDLRAADYADVARDLARRGWVAAIVVRRGFGQSDGPFSAAGAGCDRSDMVQRFDNEAQELEAALKALAERPDVEADRIIALGQSAGGAAVMALAQRKPRGLKAVVNLAGGLNLGDCVEKGRDALVATVRHWPWKDTLPQLWVYAGNDELFPPSLVDRMRAAALDRGGDVRFIGLPEIKPSGHAVLQNTRARFVWLRELDTSLRAWKLPTLPLDRPQAEFARLGLSGRVSGFEGYFSAPGEKAMAVSRTGKTFGYWYGAKDLETARRNALSECDKKAKNCSVAFENDRTVGAP